MKPRNRMGRRSFMKGTAGMAAVPFVQGSKAEGTPPSGATPSRLSRKDNPVVEENSKPGTVEWQLQYTRFDDPITLASYPLNRQLRSAAVEGYTSKNSVLPGESIDIMVSMNPAAKFTIDLYRMGYYGGAGGRHMARLGPFKGVPQPMPMMTMERLRECAWEKCTTLTIPKDWPSGVYLGKLTRDEDFGAESYVIFVVKERRKTDLLFQTSDFTWNAYNKWPGKNSLYDDGTPEVWYTGPNVRVSFDRPYAKYCQVVDAPATVGSGSFLLWEFPMVFWLERQGYDVTYCSNVDLHLDPEILKMAKVAVINDDLVPHRIAGKEGQAQALVAGLQRLLEHLTRPVFVVAGGEKYEGLGVRAGDRIRGLIGWEYNWIPAEIPGLEVVATSPLTPRSTEWAKDQRHHAVVFPCSKGNWVFNAGTIWWSEGLSCPPGHIPARVGDMAGAFGVNPKVERITANVLDRMIMDSPRL